MGNRLCRDRRFVFVARFAWLADLHGARFAFLFDRIGVPVGARFAFVVRFERDLFG